MMAIMPGFFLLHNVWRYGTNRTGCIISCAFPRACKFYDFGVQKILDCVHSDIFLRKLMESLGVDSGILSK